MNDDCMDYGGGETQGNQTLEDEVKKENKYNFLKASPAEFKTFSYEDQLYWVYAQFVFKRNYLLFDEEEDEVVEEEDEPDSESSEESESEESESEEESDNEPDSKESKTNDNRGYGPKGLAYPTAAA